MSSPTTAVLLSTLKLSPLRRFGERSPFIFALLMRLAVEVSATSAAEAFPTQPGNSSGEMPPFEVEAQKLLPTLVPYPDIQRPRISPREPPLRLFYPGSGYTAGISAGQATVGVMLDDAGKPTDYLLVAYTQDYFGHSLLRKAREIEYVPLIIKGLAVPSRYQVGYRFTADLPVILNGNQALAAWRINSAEPPFIYRPYPESELDQKLELIQAALPRLPRGFPAKDPSKIGTIVSFYVDETGNVRLPNVDFTPSGELVRNTIKAVLLWKFNPPTLRGKPVLAYAAREVTFRESAK